MILDFILKAFTWIFVGLFSFFWILIAVAMIFNLYNWIVGIV